VIDSQSLIAAAQYHASCICVRLADTTMIEQRKRRLKVNRKFLVYCQLKVCERAEVSALNVVSLLYD
jgi:hypothetical protein